MDIYLFCRIEEKRRVMKYSSFSTSFLHNFTVRRRLHLEYHHLDEIYINHKSSSSYSTTYNTSSYKWSPIGGTPTTTRIWEHSLLVSFDRKDMPIGIGTSRTPSPHWKRLSNINTTQHPKLATKKRHRWRPVHEFGSRLTMGRVSNVQVGFEVLATKKKEGGKAIAITINRLIMLPTQHPTSDIMKSHPSAYMIS